MYVLILTINTFVFLNTEKIKINNNNFKTHSDAMRYDFKNVGNNFTDKNFNRSYHALHSKL